MSNRDKGKDVSPYPWTTCSYCGKELPKGFPKPFCDDCAQRISKQALGKTKVKGERYEF